MVAVGLTTDGGVFETAGPAVRSPTEAVVASKAAATKPLIRAPGAGWGVLRSRTRRSGAISANLRNMRKYLSGNHWPETADGNAGKQPLFND